MIRRIILQAAEQPRAAPEGQSGMMAGMMSGMPMMNMMQMMGGDGPGMGMIDHVEGRIAFLCAELKITDAQYGNGRRPDGDDAHDATRTNARPSAIAKSLNRLDPF
jgi:hypothetical protein